MSIDKILINFGNRVWLAAQSHKGWSEVETKQALLKEYLDMIGEDEDADWQIVWHGRDKHKIDDPEITARNELKAELRTKAKERFQ